jgi:hypothetical protein
MRAPQGRSALRNVHFIVTCALLQVWHRVGWANRPKLTTKDREACHAPVADGEDCGQLVTFLR